MFGETHTYDNTDRHMTTTKGGTTVTYVRDATDRIVVAPEALTIVPYAATPLGGRPVPLVRHRPDGSPTDAPIVIRRE